MTEPILLRGITWNHDRGLGGLRATADQWAEREPRARVEWTARSLQAFADAPVDVLAERFDLLMIDHPSVGEAVAKASLVPLDDHLESSYLEDQASASVGLSAESYRWDDRTWALPTDAAAQVAAYRPDLLERAGRPVPRSWDDVFGLPEAGVTVGMPSIPVDAACAWLGLSGAPHGELPSRDATGEVLSLLRRLVRAAHPESLTWNPPSALERMATTSQLGYVPLAFGYSNYARTGYRPNLVRFTAPPGRGTLGGAGLAVSANSRHIEEAVRYAAFVAEGETQRTTYFGGGGQPGHRSAWTDPAVDAAASSFFSETLPALDQAYLRPRHAGFIGFQDRVGQAIHDWLRKDRDDTSGVLDELEAAYGETSSKGGRTTG